jgi:hypothetical protein
MSVTTRRKKKALLRRLKEMPCPRCPLTIPCINDNLTIRRCVYCKRHFYEKQGNMYNSWEALPKHFAIVCPRPRDDEDNTALYYERERPFVCASADCQRRADEDRERRRVFENKSLLLRMKEKKRDMKKGQRMRLFPRPHVPKKLWGGK